MDQKKRYFIIFITFLIINIFSISGMASNESSNKSTNTDFLIQKPSGHLYFSTDTDNNASTANIYTIDSSFDSLLLNNYSIMNDQIASSNTISLSVQQLLGDYGYVQYANYFISNNIKFVILRTYLYPTNTFTILSLDTNKAISFQSNTSAYYLSLISTFPNSPDVYFNLNNETNFLIIKYSFSNNNFSIFFQTSFSNIKIPVTSIYQDGKIFILINSIIQNSQILTFNDQGLIYSKYMQYSIETFTIFNGGFLFYTTTGSLYSYSYNNSYSFIANYNDLKILLPFDNNSFLAVSTNYLSIFKINDTDQSLSIKQEYNYTINYSGDVYLLYYFQALTVNGIRYFMYQSQNSYSGDNYLAINHVYNAPVNFNGPMTTSTTNNYSNSQSQTYTSTVSSVSVQYISSNNNNSSIFIIIVVVGILAIGPVIFVSKRNSTSKNDFMKKNDTLFNTKSKSDNYLHSEMQNRSYCLYCGSPTQLDDVFCQNCGNKLI